MSDSIFRLLSRSLNVFGTLLGSRSHDLPLRFDDGGEVRVFILPSICLSLLAFASVAEDGYLILNTSTTKSLSTPLFQIYSPDPTSSSKSNPTPDLTPMPMSTPDPTPDSVSSA